MVVKMRKINLNVFLVNFAIIIFLAIALIRVYLSNISWSISIVLMAVANIFLIINLFNIGKLKRKSLLFVLLCLIMLLPTLYRNAYLEDSMYNSFIPMLLSFSFAILLYFSDIKEKNIYVIQKILIVFALLTSIVTWISFIFPNFYINNIITFLPSSEQDIVKTDFIANGMKMGLTNHYSRNALFMVLGIICLFGKLKEQKNKKMNIMLISFLFISLFLVGKRAHLIFIVLSIVFSYFIINKMSLKNFIKFIGISIIVLFFCTLCLRLIPGTDNIVQRFLMSDGSDFSSGRIGLYNMAFDKIEESNYIGIGWGQFSKSTNYFFAGVHNDYIQLLCEVGIWGFLFIVISNLIILVKSIKACENFKSGFLVCVLIYNIFFMLYSFTGIPHYDLETMMIYLLFNCLMLNYVERSELDERGFS